MADQITNYKCPACTGPLHFSGASGKLECDYCGSSFDPAEIEKLYAEKEQQADIRLFVYRGEENEYHSMSAPAAVVDALVIALSAQMGTEAVENLDAVQKLKERYRKQF